MQPWLAAGLDVPSFRELRLLSDEQEYAVITVYSEDLVLVVEQEKKKMEMGLHDQKHLSGEEKEIKETVFSSHKRLVKLCDTVEARLDKVTPLVGVIGDQDETSDKFRKMYEIVQAVKRVSQEGGLCWEKCLRDAVLMTFSQDGARLLIL